MRNKIHVQNELRLWASFLYLLPKKAVTHQLKQSILTPFSPSERDLKWLIHFKQEEYSLPSTRAMKWVYIIAQVGGGGVGTYSL